MSLLLAGVLISSYGWSITILQMPVGVISDRYEPRKILSLSMLCLFIASLWFSTSSSVISLITSRVIMGVGASFVFVAGVKTIESYYAEKDRGKAIGLFSSLANVGVVAANLFAPAILQWTDLGWRGVYGLVGLLALASSIISLKLIPRQAATSQVGNDSNGVVDRAVEDEIRLVSRNPHFWVQNVISFVYFGSNLGLLFWIPSYLKAEGFSLGFSGIAVSLIGVGSIFGSTLGGWLIDRNGKRNPVMRAFFVIYIVGILMIALLPGYPGLGSLFLISPILIGLSWGGITVNTQLVVELFPEKLVGTAFGITNTVRWFGSSLYPLMIGALLTLNFTYGESFSVLCATVIGALVVSRFSLETWQDAVL